MFRFSIRDVLWLMVVVGLGVAWWADRNRGPENARLRAENERLIKERDLAKWQIESTSRALTKRGVTLTYDEYSVHVVGGFTGKYRSGVAKKSQKPLDVIPIDERLEKSTTQAQP